MELKDEIDALLDSLNEDFPQHEARVKKVREAYQSLSPETRQAIQQSGVQHRNLLDLGIRGVKFFREVVKLINAARRGELPADTAQSPGTSGILVVPQSSQGAGGGPEGTGSTS